MEPIHTGTKVVASQTSTEVWGGTAEIRAVHNAPSPAPGQVQS